MTPSTRHVLRRDALRATVVCATDALQSRFGPRFDRTAYVEELTCAGRSFLAPAGLCDEFGLDGTGVLGFEAARPGETFLKMGVGRLVRPSDAPYDFRERYELAETFPVEITPGEASLTVRQASPAGAEWGYACEKTYALISRSALHLHYSLTNTGERSYSFEHYNHHWFSFPGPATGVDYRLQLSWPVAPPGLPWIVTPDGLGIASGALPPRGVHCHVPVPSSLVEVALADSQFHHTVTLRPDFPLARMALWANPESVCPELFYRCHLPPRATARWSVRYDMSGR